MLVLLIVGEELGLELSVERIVPFVERLVAEVAVYTEYVVTDLIVPSGILRCRIYAGFEFQFVRYLYLIFLIVVF